MYHDVFIGILSDLKKKNGFHVPLQGEAKIICEIEFQNSFLIYNIMSIYALFWISICKLIAYKFHDDEFFSIKYPMLYTTFTYIKEPFLKPKFNFIQAIFIYPIKIAWLFLFWVSIFWPTTFKKRGKNIGTKGEKIDIQINISRQIHTYNKKKINEYSISKNTYF